MMDITYIEGVYNMDIKTESKRINIRLPEYIQDWYKEQGEKYSVPYSNYIALLLTQFYEKEKDKELLVEFNQVMKTLKDQTGDVSAEEMMKEFREIKALFDDIEDKTPGK